MNGTELETGQAEMRERQLYGEAPPVQVKSRPSQTNKLRYSVPPHSWSLKKWGKPISLPHIISDPRQFVRRIFISASQRPHNGTFVALAKEAPHGRGGLPPPRCTRPARGGMRGLAVIFRCINYMANGLGKVKIRTTEGMGNVGGSALITRSPALAIA